MSKKKNTGGENVPLNKLSRLNPVVWAAGGYTLIAVMLTYPLILRMNSSIYGSYDHVSTDLFASIYYYFWSIKHSLLTLKASPIVTDMFAAPFGSRIFFANFTGFVLFPISAIFGHLFTRNLVIISNLVLSGLGMFFLVRHITKNAAAGFVAGIVFAFCPNMLVRSYTTFDTTQVQWLPLYTLYLLKFIEDRTWRNAILSGVFLCCVFLFAIPYYLVYIPIHTAVLLAVYFFWRIIGENRGWVNFFKDISTPEALRGWLKIGIAFAVVMVLFFLYLNVIVGGTSYTSSEGVQRSTEDLQALSLKPTDYLMPHPKSAFLKGNIKESYWNEKRPGKDPDSFVAYAGYTAIVLAGIGFFRGRRNVYAWIFLLCGIVAFWATMGPGLSPSGLIHSLYAPFARRILLYKVYVQMSVAALAGIGAGYVLDKLKGGGWKTYVPVALSVILLLEYSLSPPAMSVNLTEIPEVYEQIKALPDDSIIIETPLRRMNHNLYQGYLFYQTVHEKKMFNPNTGLTEVPEALHPFYTQMEVPLEAQEYSNLAALRYLGVSHMNYHWHIGTRSVVFRSFSAPGLGMMTQDYSPQRTRIDGLKSIYTYDQSVLDGSFVSPFDYTFADLYEITADPCPVALTFDYHSPFEQIPGVIQQDFPTEYGWVSAHLDTAKTFYYPVASETKLVRMMRQGGEVTATNISDGEVSFVVSFNAEASGMARSIDVKWNGSGLIGSLDYGLEPGRCETKRITLGPSEQGIISIWSKNDVYGYPIDVPGGKANLPVMAVLSDFRVAIDK